MDKAGVRYFLEPEGGCAKVLRSVVLVVNSLSLDRTKLRHLRSHSHSRLHLDSLSLNSRAAYMHNSHPYIVGEEQVSRTNPRKTGPTVNMSKSIYSLTKVDNNTHGQEPYLAGSLDFYTQEQCDSHARAGDQTQVLSRSTLIQHPSWLTACDPQFLPQGKLSASPRARYTSKRKKHSL
jgi:hypothetical protein